MSKKKMTATAAIRRIKKLEAANVVLDRARSATALASALCGAAQLAAVLFPASRVLMLLGRLTVGAATASLACVGGQAACQAAARRTIKRVSEPAAPGAAAPRATRKRKATVEVEVQ